MVKTKHYPYNTYIEPCKKSFFFCFCHYLLCSTMQYNEIAWGTSEAPKRGILDQNRPFWGPWGPKRGPIQGQSMWLS